MTIPQIRVRTKKPKTKTGCRTCRIRRIKCDEVRPDCCKCSSTGRSCEWFENTRTNEIADGGTTLIRVSTANCAPISIRPWYALLGELNSLEGHSFAFFRHHTAAQIQGTFDSNLWSSSAMQLSHREPAVMHAIIAVGSLHQARSGLNRAHPRPQDYDISDDDLQDYQTQRRFALLQYSKAVVLLRQNIEGDRPSMTADIVLLVCLLFVGFELLQGNVEAAMNHLDHGLGIITETHPRILNKYVLYKGITPDHLIDEVVPAFARLDYASTMFGQRHPTLNLADYALSQSLCMPKSFCSVRQAKAYLELLASGVLRLRGDLLLKAEAAALLSPRSPSPLEHRQCYVKALSRSVDLGSDGPPTLARRDALEAGLLTFASAFKVQLGSLRFSTSRSIMAIQIEYVQILFLVMTCRQTRETLFDVFDSLFDSTMDLAAKYMNTAPRFSDSKPKRAFALEPGILPTTFLVAEKCRDTAIRQKAIELMREGCIREAMWDGKPYSTFMQMLANIEATGISSSHGPPDTTFEEPSRCHILPETARMSDVILLGDREDARLICARYRHESDGQIEITEHAVGLGNDPDYLHDICYGWS